MDGPVPNPVTICQHRSRLFRPHPFAAARESRRELKGSGMDGILAIEHNRQALKRILATLFAMAGFGSRGQFTFFPQEGASAQNRAQAEKSKLSPALTLPRHLYLSVLRLLRPARSAVRRLIIASARGLTITLPPSRPARKPKPAPTILRNGVGTGIILLRAHPGAFPGSVHYFPQRGTPETGAGGKKKSCPQQLPLLDPFPRPFRRRRPPQTAVPRITLPGYTDPFPIKVRQPPSRQRPDRCDASWPAPCRAGFSTRRFAGTGPAVRALGSPPRCLGSAREGPLRCKSAECRTAPSASWPAKISPYLAAQAGSTARWPGFRLHPRCSKERRSARSTTSWRRLTRWRCSRWKARHALDAGPLFAHALVVITDPPLSLPDIPPGGD